MPSFAVPRGRRLQSETGTNHDHPRIAGLVTPCRARRGRSPRLVEGDRRPPAAGRDDGAALGEAGRHARAPPRPPEDGIGLRLQDRSRRVGAKSRFGSRRRARRRAAGRRPDRAVSCPCGALSAVGPLARCRRRRGPHRSVPMAAPERRDGSGESAGRGPVSDADRLRRDRAGGRDFPRRKIRGLPVRSRRTDGRLGHPGRRGSVLQPDSRHRAGARQSVGPHAGLLTRWDARHVLGPEGRRSRAIGHRRVGGTRARRSATTLPRGRRRVRLVRRRHSTRLSHAWPGRSPVRSRRRPAVRAPPDLLGPGRPAQPLPRLVPGPGVHLLRPGLGARPHGRLADQADRRRARDGSRATTRS